MAAEIKSAIVVPVIENGKTIGVGFVGDGAFALTFPDRADAERFANRQVLLGRRPAADVSAVAHGEAPFTSTISRGFVFGSEAVLAPWLKGEPADGSSAATALAGRLELLAGAVDLSAGSDASAPVEKWIYADFFVSHRLFYVRPTGGPAEDDRWLAVVRDDLRFWPPADVMAIGRDEHGDIRQNTVSLGRWMEPDRNPTGPRIRNGIESVSIEASVEARSISARAHVALKADSTFVLKAHREIAKLEIDVPRVESAKGSWSVTHLSVDGVEVAVPDGLDKGATVTLPTPVASGAEARVRVVYLDTWALGGAGQNAGRATTPRSPLPDITDLLDTDFVLRVGTAAEARLVSAQSGNTAREWDADGVHWVESTTDGDPVTPVIAFGEWVTASEASVEGLPAIRVNLFTDEASGISEFPPFLRTVVAYYQNLLPPFPSSELELLQQRDGMGRFTWTARQGLVTLQQMQIYGDESDTRADEPHLEQNVMAHEVAHQWWGSLVTPARAEDRWMSETMATAYACLFVGMAYGPKDCEVRKDSWRETWEKEQVGQVGASLRDAWGSPQWIDVAYEYGPYVMLHMLRGRLGDEAYFSALDGYARDRADRPATTDRLQAAFEATSGRDLDAFFAYWVVGGHIPSLQLVLEDKKGTITSDVPFGTFDVPIYAITDAGKEEVWVQVIDGKGTFELTQRPTKIQLDPEGMVLAKARKIVKR